eukprot:m.144651 g.144651  ORF g.144651 m.144651 type:complete len:409 (-) comp16047_c3_seq3:675-1901(-)
MQPEAGWTKTTNPHKRRESNRSSRNKQDPDSCVSRYQNGFSHGQGASQTDVVGNKENKENKENMENMENIAYDQQTRSTVKKSRIITSNGTSTRLTFEASKSVVNTQVRSAVAQKPRGTEASASTVAAPMPSNALCAAILDALANDNRDDDEHRTMKFCSAVETWQAYKKKIAVFGVIAELFVEGATASPSVQCVISSSGTVEVISTHEQILDGQMYKGCEFPANDAYNQQLVAYGHQVASFLASQGVVDNMGIDFMGVPCEDGSWELQALEINLRLCGTTHPLMTLKLLTGGALDPSSGLYVTHRGENRYYVATDNLEDASLQALTPGDLVEVFRENHLHYNPKTEVGVVFHLLSCLSEWGKVGMTAIGSSREEAHRLFDEACELILDVSTLCSSANMQNVPQMHMF